MDDLRRMKEIPAQSVHIVSVHGDELKPMKMITGGGGATPVYHGQTTFTPTDSTQIVPVAGHRLDRNITINPIPSNYGLITWNGSVLTVS